MLTEKNALKNALCKPESSFPNLALQRKCLPGAAISWAHRARHSSFKFSHL